MRHLIVCIGSLCSLLFVACESEEVPEARPNIVLFLVDDMGWQDTSVSFWSRETPFNERYRTPHMERLAREGMKFTQAYATPVCSPSRVSLMTGMNAARHRVTNWTLKKDSIQPMERNHPDLVFPIWNVNGLSPVAGDSLAVHAMPLTQALHDAGYYTVHAGKAHFGAIGTPGADPRNLGFDVNIAGHAAGAPGSYWGTEDFGNGTPGREAWAVPGLESYHGQEIHLTEALTQEALMALDSVVDTPQPFFLYMAHYAVHTPIMADDRFVGHYLEQGLDSTEAKYASMVEGMDKSLGDIMDYLEERNVAENTVILFMSDNGGLSVHTRGGEPNTHNKPLASGKGSMYEGGIREPMLVKWPGITEPETVTDYQVIIEDFYPTLLEIAGVDSLATIQHVDGRSFVDVLTGSLQGEGARPLFWHYPNEWGPEGPGIGAASVVRAGDWKLIYFHADQHMELYNLALDIGETENRFDSDPDQVRELAILLTRHLLDTRAQMPIHKASGEQVPYPTEVLGLSDIGVPPSFIHENLEFVGVAVEDPDYTLWGAAPIQDDDGKTHLFVARWPERNVDPAWRTSSEIAHYVADRPEGPFAFSEVALVGTGEETWDKFAPHNPEIKKVGDTYVLLYIANTDPQQPPHPANQRIGMAVSKSLYGPWEKVGADGLILDADDPGKWNHASANGVANPTFLRINDQYYLYFKTHHQDGNLVYGLAIADSLEGPYTITDSPVTSNKGTLEDGSVFLYDGSIYLLTTDNHGENTGIVGGGTLWKSDDGRFFDHGEATIGYDRLPAYFSDYEETKTTKIYGPDPKIERPKILLIEGKPAYLYGPSGWNVYGGDRTVVHVFKIDMDA